MKHKILIWLVIILVAGTVAYLNRATLIQKVQLLRLKSLKCPSNRPDCHQLLWAHRVNSIAKYKELETDLSGFEIDVTYIDSLDRFYVFHPPAENLQKITAWQKFYRSIDQKKKYYLDMRGVDSSNVDRAIKTLEQDSETTFLKKQTVIELYDYHAANTFFKLGYNVTLNYYALRSLSTVDTQTGYYKDAIKNIKQVSGDAISLTEMRKNFPDKKYIIWDLSYKNYISTQKLLNNISNANIVLILVSISSKYSR